MMEYSWLVCVLVEWVSLIILVHSLEDEGNTFDFRKAIIYLFTYAVFYAGMSIANLSEIFSIIYFILLFIYIKWSYKEELGKVFTILVVSSVLISLIEMICARIVMFFGSVQPQIGFFEISSTVLTLILSIILLKMKLYRIVDIMEQREILYVVVAILSMMIFTPVVALKILKKMDVVDYLYIAVCIIVMWMLVSKLQQYKLETKIRKKYLEEYSKVITQIRRRQHAVKNQFNTALGMHALYNNYDELVEKQKDYLGRLNSYELPTDAIILEDPAVVALIYEKLNEAMEEGILVDTTFKCSMLDRKFSDLMWVEIIGVLLDNAIEALQNYEGAKKLWISIHEADKNKIQVEIINTFRELKHSELEQFFQEGYSTKGENRGIGLYHVKEQVYKNRGEVIAINKEMNGNQVNSFTVII